jgi:nitrogen fixation NifU-like protein
MAPDSPAARDDATPLDEAVGGRASLRYGPVVMDHFRNPRNVGPVPGGNVEITVGSPADGDTLRLYARVTGGRVEAAGFHTFGCVAAIAASSVLTELLSGRTLEEAGRLGDADVAAALGGLTADKVHCSVLAAEAVRRLLEAARRLPPAAR